MRIEIHSKLTAAAASGGVALGALVLASAAGARLGPDVIPGTAAVVLFLTTLAAGRTVLHAWQGPAVVSFRRDESVVCDPRQAVAVRAAAQLRGTLGGAGHVRRERLAYAAAAWLTAGLFAGAALAEGWRHAALGCGVLALLLSLVAARYPARPFFYREAMGGWLVVHPPGTLERLIGAAARAGEEPLDAAPPTARVHVENGWGSSLSPPEIGGKPPPAPADRAP